ncbi:hypothetical protein MUO32_22590 [Shinella sp. CPCC 101442]|uniref:hypothetical protein n=1 Tax=Shinella sp. CPCC 101442 TaxID=2932265 RepID=UPI002152E965|nr:hypothetical protein [Shinella sp. CPCC 101442]MCR6501829.1 hypothetical protein [Shinella sp. CPCC 101442]
MLWTIIIACLFLAGLIFRHSFRRDDGQEQAGDDSGLAIVEFGRAFPEEAIRAVVTTRDRRTVFLRLHDGKAGCMQAHGHHYACHLIEPGTVRVSSAGPKRLSIQFANAAFEGGTYEFQDEKEAAEVSLWLLGSFMPGAANLNAQPVN